MEQNSEPEARRLLLLLLLVKVVAQATESWGVLVFSDDYIKKIFKKLCNMTVVQSG